MHRRAFIDNRIDSTIAVASWLAMPHLRQVTSVGRAGGRAGGQAESQPDGIAVAIDPSVDLGGPDPATGGAPRALGIELFSLQARRGHGG